MANISDVTKYLSKKGVTNLEVYEKLLSKDLWEKFKVAKLKTDTDIETFIHDEIDPLLTISREAANAMGLNPDGEKDSFLLSELVGMVNRYGYVNLSTISDPHIKEAITERFAANHSAAIDLVVDVYKDVTREQIEALVGSDILFTSAEAARKMVIERMPFRREFTDETGTHISRASFEDIDKSKASEYSFSVYDEDKETEMKLDEVRDDGFSAEGHYFTIESGVISQVAISPDISTTFGITTSDYLTPKEFISQLTSANKTLSPERIVSSSMPEEFKTIILKELYSVSQSNFEKAANEFGDFSISYHPNDLLFLQYDKEVIRGYVLEKYPFRNNEFNDTLKPFSRKNTLSYSDPSKTSYTRVIDGEEVEVKIASIDKDSHTITLENGESFYFYGFEGDGPNIEGAIAPMVYNGKLSQEQFDKLKSMIGKGEPAITKLPISVSMDSGVVDRAGNTVDEQVYRHVGLSFEIDNATTLEEINQAIENKIKELQDKYNEAHPEVTPPAPGRDPADPGDPGNPTGGGAPPPAGGRPPLRGPNMGVAGKQYKMKFVDIKFAYLRSLLDLAERDEGFVLPQDVQDKIDALYSLDEAVTPTTLMDTIKKLQNSMLRRWKEGSDRGDLRKQLIMMNKHHNEELIELSREAYANPEPEQPAATPRKDLIVVFDEIQQQDRNDRNVRISAIKSKHTRDEVRQETDKMYTALVGDPIDMVSLSEKMNIIMNYQKWINQLEKLKSDALIAREKAELFTSGTAFPGEDPVKEYQQVNAKYINAFLKFKAFCETKTPAGVDYRTIANAGIGLIQAIRVGDEISGNTGTRPLFAVSEPREDMNAYNRYIQLYNKLNKVRSELRSLRQKRSTTFNKQDRIAIDDRIEQLEIQCITYEKAVTNMVKKDVDGNRATPENPSQVRSYEERLLTNSLLGRLGVFSTEAGKTAIRYDIDGTEAFIAPKTVSALGSKIHLMRPGKGRTPEGLGISPLVNLDNFFVLQRVFNGHDITPEQLQEMSAALEEAPARPERDSDDGRDEM